MVHSSQLYIALALLLALSVLGYFSLKNVAPIFARIFLALGGAVAGSFLAISFLLLFVELFRDGWNGFGLLFWGAPIFFVGAGIGGFLAALQWTAQTIPGRRKLNIALYSTVLLTPAVLFVLPNLVAFALNDTRGDTLHERSITIDEFTASAQSAVFVIPTHENVDVRALVYVDRATRKAWRIGEKDFSYRQPRLSWDGKRLLFVRQKRDSTQHDLISRAVKSWLCKIVVQTEYSVMSPTEIDRDLIIYSASPLITIGERRGYIRYKFYLAKVGFAPIQLSNMPLLTLYGINVAGDKILFGSVLPSNPHARFDLFAPRSDIFEWKINRKAAAASIPPQELAPKFFAAGYSTHPSMSQDGKKVAFLNTELGKGRYRYNLMIVDGFKGSRKLIKLEGNNFSQAAFAGDQMLYNELLNDRYRVRAWNQSTDTIEDIFEIRFSKLENLPHIVLSFTSHVPTVR